MSIKIEGFFQKDIFSRGDFKIISVFPTLEYKDKVKINKKYGNISISGIFPPMLEKVKYTFSIYEDENSKYENSYKLENFFINEKKSEVVDNKFLQTMLTENQYETLTNAYSNVLELLIKDKPIDVAKLNGIGEKSLEKIREKIKKNYPLFELINKYSDLGLTTTGLQKLLDKYKSVEMIDKKMKEDAYGSLVCIGGIGFKKADLCLLRKFPELINSETRAVACISYILKTNEVKGNTWMTFTSLYKQFIESANECRDKFEKALSSDFLYYNSKLKRVSLYSTYMCEKEVCNSLLKFNSTKTLLNIDYQKYNMVDGVILSEEQQVLPKLVCENNLCLLTGFAGSGKTFSTKALINMLDESNIQYILMTPTGKSSKVFSENTGKKAHTIHRGLKYKPGEGFRYNSNNKLPEDIIIIDEFSMIDIFLMRDLLRAIKDDAKIIFIGDSDQIPSVGAGNCAYDMLQSKIIPTSSLTNVFRYGEGGLSYVVSEARQGKYYLKQKSNLEVFGEKKDYVFLNTKNTIETTKLLYKKILKEKNANIEDIGVLTAYNKGELGIYSLNNMLQELVNPRSATKNEVTMINKDNVEVTYREGDLVMQLTNNYKAKTISGETIEIFNGDVGKILKIYGNKIQILFDSDIVQLDRKTLRNINLAYSMTFHKSQGSSIKFVIVVTPHEHSFFLNRNLFYVALSRARQLVYNVGDFATIKSILRKSENLRRDTYLKEMLQLTI